MPTYDYRCTACNHAFEHFQSISSPLLRKCPECGKTKLERLIGAGAGFLFKGAGFYITDYRSNSYQKAAKKDAPPASGGTASDGKSKAGDAAAPPAAAPKTPTEPAAPATPTKAAPKRSGGKGKA